MRVLDLFAGTGSATAAFAERGHEVVRVELDQRFKPDVCADVLTLTAGDLPGPWDFVWASPPCEGMGVPQMGRNWLRPGVARPGSKGEVGYALLRHTLGLIQDVNPRAFIIENPRAMMRQLPEMMALERRTITYCQYGMHYQKPTDLFGGFPPTLKLHRPCEAGAPCHEAAPRGSSGGIQGLANSEVRAVLPAALSMAVCMAMENWQGIATRRQALLVGQEVEQSQ